MAPAAARPSLHDLALGKRTAKRRPAWTLDGSRDRGAGNPRQVATCVTKVLAQSARALVADRTCSQTDETIDRPQERVPPTERGKSNGTNCAPLVHFVHACTKSKRKLPRSQKHAASGKRDGGRNPPLRPCLPGGRTLRSGHSTTTRCTRRGAFIGFAVQHAPFLHWQALRFVADKTPRYLCVF
jgi:hypothetical protein